MNTIFYSEEAKETYRIFLKSFYDYSSTSALRFDDKVQAYLKKMESFASICPALKNYPNLR